MPSDMTFKQLLRETRGLAKDVRADAEAIKKEADGVDDAAKDTLRVSEQIAAMEVSQLTVAETRDLAKTMAGVSEAANTYTSSADTTARYAQAAEQQAQDSHGRISEAISASPEHAGNSAWYRQE